MQDGLVKLGGVVALGLAATWMQGCKQKVAPVVAQPAVRSAPRVRETAPSDLPPDDEVVPDVKAVASRPRSHRVAEPPVVPPPPVDVQAVEEAQRMRDGALLKQQEAASERQQKELNGVVQQSLKLRQEQQAEPRIQDAPEAPPSLFAQPGPDDQGIHDAPGPAQTAPAPPPPQEPLQR